MTNTLFIVWRESIEALLVIGILYAWIKAHPHGATGMKYLWAGVLGGLLLAGVLGASMMGVGSLLGEVALERFQVVLMILAAGLITQMVFWMKRHGRQMKSTLEGRLAEAANWGAVALIAALAVAREGAETVVFLYGSGMGQQGEALWQFVLGATLGLGLALFTFFLLANGGRFLSWKRFFAVSEVILLLLACGMLVGATEKMIDFGWLPTLLDPVWDSAFLLDDQLAVGKVLATFAGYRAHPALMLVMIVAAYWSAVLLWSKRARR
jgi:high-affinity iron transporter